MRHRSHWASVLMVPGVDYAKRMKSYNPLLWMVAGIVWYKIVHVGDFILSLLRLYLCFFHTFIYGFLHTWGLGGNLHFFRLKYFLLFNPRFYTNSHKSLILFYGSFLNFGTNSYKLIHTINLQIIVRIRIRCGFCTNSCNCYTNCIVRIRTRSGFCTHSDNF